MAHRWRLPVAPQSAPFSRAIFEARGFRRGRARLLWAGAFALTSCVAAAQGGLGAIEAPVDGSGVLAGGMVISPSIETEAGYSDNYLLDPDGPDSVYASVKPRLLATTSWGVHQAVFTIGGEATTYAESSDDDVYTADVGGQLLIGVVRGTELKLAGSYSREAETSADDFAPENALGSTSVNVLRASAAVRHNPGLIGLYPFLDYQRILYDETELTTGGEASNDDRDRQALTFGLEATYEYAAGYEAFVRGTGLRTSYDQERDAAGVERGSTTATALAGVNFRVTNLIEGAAGVGFTRRMFDDASFKDIDGIAFDVSLNWSPLESLKISVEGFQKFEESTIDGVSTENELGVKLGVDYALFDDVSLSSKLGYTHSTFEGSSREDDLFEASLAIAYHLSPFVEVGGGYAYALDATNSGQDASENRVFVGVSAWY